LIGMTEVRPVTPEQFDAIHPLLARFGQTAMTRADWRRMLFDLPWPVDVPHRGYALWSGDTAVGFLGTIFSTRSIAGTPRRFCNLSSWIVDDAHRASSMQLMMPVLALKQHTLVNLSASPTAHEVLTRLGFQTLESDQVLIVPLPNLGSWLRVRCFRRPEVVVRHLDPAGRTLFDDMRGTQARQLVVLDGTRVCHVIATQSPWKPDAALAYVHFASDWSMLFEHAAAVAWGFYRAMGSVGLRIDGRRAPARLPWMSRRKQLALPMLYRPATPDLTPDRIDALYSEVVGQRW
jgi:hypothetical protein